MLGCLTGANPSLPGIAVEGREDWRRVGDATGASEAATGGRADGSATLGGHDDGNAGATGRADGRAAGGLEGLADGSAAPGGGAAGGAGTAAAGSGHAALGEGFQAGGRRDGAGGGREGACGDFAAREVAGGADPGALRAGAAGGGGADQPESTIDALNFLGSRRSAIQPRLYHLAPAAGGTSLTPSARR